MVMARPKDLPRAHDAGLFDGVLPTDRIEDWEKQEVDDGALGVQLQSVLGLAQQVWGSG